MEHRTSTDDAVVPQLHVPGEEGRIGDHVVVPDLHIMRKVDRGHDEVPVSHSGDGTGLRASMNRDLLADDIVFSNDDTTGRRCLEGQVLGIAADDRGASDGGAAADGDIAHELSMGFELHISADFGRSVDDDVGADLGTGIDLGISVNDGGGMDHEDGESAPAERKL